MKNKRLHKEVSELIKKFLTDLERIERRKSIFVNLEVDNYYYETLEYGGFEKQKYHKLDYVIEVV